MIIYCKDGSQEQLIVGKLQRSANGFQVVVIKITLKKGKAGYKLGIVMLEKKQEEFAGQPKVEKQGG